MSDKIRLKEVLSLIASGNLNQKDANGVSALQKACLSAELELLKILIEAGADLEAVAENGQTALIEASSKGHHQVVKILIDAGAELEASDQTGQTALLRASSNGHTEVLSLLIAGGADVNATDQKGVTPLIEAAFCQTPVEVFRLLIAGGADVSTKDDDGFTALRIVLSDGDSETLHLLESAIENEGPKSAEALIRSLNKDYKKRQQHQNKQALFSRSQDFLREAFLAQKSLHQTKLEGGVSLHNGQNLISLYLNMEENKDGKYYFLDQNGDPIKHFPYDPDETPDSLL